MSESNVNLASSATDQFKKAIQLFEGLAMTLSKSNEVPASHEVIEEQIQTIGTEAMRLLFQGYFELKSYEEIVDDDYRLKGEGKFRRTRSGCERKLTSRFGRISFTRIGYSFTNGEGIFPLDAKLNLPKDSYSYGLHRLAAKYSAELSFDKTVDFIKDASGARFPKRQVERSAVRTSELFDKFYKTTQAANDSAADQLLVLTADAKGVVMREESLRPQTRRNAEKKAMNQRKRKHRLGKGEKNNRKRMAEVVSVYEIAPHFRTPDDIMKGEQRRKAPRPEIKKVWASVSKPSAAVLNQMVEYAKKRDTELSKNWYCLLDGHAGQLSQALKCFKEHGITNVTIVIDIIHVIEYLWKASYCFHKAGTDEAQAWVSKRLGMLLNGEVCQVAKGMRQSATKAGLSRKKRAAVDICADYLLNLKPYMQYDKYLAEGAPIATGVIEGACRYLIKDRMDITGARWHLEGAEAILRNRALVTNGDLDSYWKFYTNTKQRENYPYLPKVGGERQAA